jgi:3-oxoacyl-[acyl-carrier-protein] synthase-3
MAEPIKSAARLREIVEQCIRRELPAGVSLPAESEDLVENGTLDSMAWVAAVRCLEKAAGVPNLADILIEDEPRSMQSLVAALLRAGSAAVAGAKHSGVESARAANGMGLAGIVSWGSALGTQLVEIARVEEEFSLAAGTLRDRAGIDSIARVQPGETEIDLAVRAAASALEKNQTDVADVDCIVVSSETHVGFPSLAASLHSRLLANEAAGAFDIGGACAGLLNALFFAQSVVLAGQAKQVLVVTSDVHSQRLRPPEVAGQFGGLFGDGASAFLVCRLGDSGEQTQYPWRLGDFQFGCAGTFASAITVTSDPRGALQVVFEGEALARAALRELQRIIEDLELRSGFNRKAASSFATHQPNPRILDALARQLGVPLEKFPTVAKTSGNLGSSTCGVALAKALDRCGDKPSERRGPIFLAALGPGLLWGGGILY